MRWLKINLWCRIFHNGYISPIYGSWTRTWDCKTCENVEYCFLHKKVHWKARLK